LSTCVAVSVGYYRRKCEILRSFSTGFSLALGLSTGGLTWAYRVLPYRLHRGHEFSGFGHAVALGDHRCHVYVVSICHKSILYHVYAVLLDDYTIAYHF